MTLASGLTIRSLPATLIVSSNAAQVADGRPLIRAAWILEIRQRPNSTTTGQHSPCSTDPFKLSATAGIEIGVSIRIEPLAGTKTPPCNETGVALVAIGIIGGLAGGIALTRVMAGLLHGVATTSSPDTALSKLDG